MLGKLPTRNPEIAVFSLPYATPCALPSELSCTLSRGKNNNPPLNHSATETRYAFLLAGPAKHTNNAAITASAIGKP